MLQDEGGKYKGQFAPIATKNTEKPVICNSNGSSGELHYPSNKCHGVHIACPMVAMPIQIDPCCNSAEVCGVALE